MSMTMDKLKTVLNKTNKLRMSMDELIHIISIHPKKLLIVPVQDISIGMIKPWTRTTDMLGVPMNTFLDFDKILKPGCKYFDKDAVNKGFPNKMAYIEFLNDDIIKSL